MPISKNYSGRSVDLSIFPTLQTPDTPVDAEFSSNSRVIAGPMAAAQNFVRLLLTPLGHYKSDPTLGTEFYQHLSPRHLRYPTDLLHLFLIEGNRVLDYLARNADTVPDDEKIKDVDLLNSSIRGTNIDMTIEIETVAGETVTLLLPVQWSI